MFRPNLVRRNSAEDVFNFVQLTLTDQVLYTPPPPLGLGLCGIHTKHKALQ
jgi:hypothetical protein